MARGAGMTQYLVPEADFLGNAGFFGSAKRRLGPLKTIYLNFNTFLSHRDRTSLRMSASGKGVPCGASPCLDSSRRTRCRSTLRAFFWPLPSLLFRHVRFGPPKSLRKLKHKPVAKNLLSLNQHQSRKSLCSLVNTSNIVLGQASAPVPYHPARTIGVV